MIAREAFGRQASLYAALALRNLARQGTRTALTLAAIALGVASVVLAGGFIEDIFVQLGEATIHSQLGHIQIHRSGYLTSGTQHPLEYLISEPREAVDVARSIPQTGETLERLNFSGLLSNGTRDLAVLGEGVEPAKERLLATYHHVLEGKPLATDDRDGVYVGEGVAKSLGLHAGSVVTLLASTASGALNTLDARVVGIFRSYSKEYDARVVQMNLPAAQELLQTKGVNTIVVLLRETSATDSVAAKLRSALAADKLDIRTWDTLSDFYAKTVRLFRRQFGFLEVVIALLIVLSAQNAINLSLNERRGEFGTMRAIGSSGGHVIALIATESVALGIAGSLLGAAIGVGLAMAISSIGIPMPPPPNAELGYLARIRLEPSIILAAIAIGVGSTIAASLLPAFRISRMPIVDALRQNV